MLEESGEQGVSMIEERKTGLVQISNIVYYFVNGLVVGYATVKELGNTTQTAVSVEE